MTNSLLEGHPVPIEIPAPPPQEAYVDLDIARIAADRLAQLLKGHNDPQVTYNLGLLSKALKASRKTKKPKT